MGGKRSIIDQSTVQQWAATCPLCRGCAQKADPAVLRMGRVCLANYSDIALTGEAHPNVFGIILRRVLTEHSPRVPSGPLATARSGWIALGILAVIAAGFGGSSREDVAQLIALRPLMVLMLVPALYWLAWENTCLLYTSDAADE